ncbi:MAG: hypothetical protein GXO78_04280 [Calditrichaeota bacterium]|nr:hypothetical protein [Calditrichota bacterium]
MSFFKQSRNKTGRWFWNLSDRWLIWALWGILWLVSCRSPAPRITQQANSVDTTAAFTVSEVKQKRYPEGTYVKVKGIIICVDLKVKADYTGPGSGCYLVDLDHTGLPTKGLYIGEPFQFMPLNRVVIVGGYIFYCEKNKASPRICGLKNAQILSKKNKTRF